MERTRNNAANEFAGLGYSPASRWSALRESWCVASSGSTTNGCGPWRGHCLAACPAAFVALPCATPSATTAIVSGSAWRRWPATDDQQRTPALHPSARMDSSTEVAGRAPHCAECDRTRRGPRDEAVSRCPSRAHRPRCWGLREGVSPNVVVSTSGRAPHAAPNTTSGGRARRPRVRAARPGRAGTRRASRAR